MSDVQSDGNIRRVRKIAVDHLGVEEAKVTLDARLAEELGADSLDHVELVMAVEEEFQIEIPDEAAEKMKTILDVVEYVNKHAG